jgi:hypothetical protein
MFPILFIRSCGLDLRRVIECNRLLTAKGAPDLCMTSF